MKLDTNRTWLVWSILSMLLFLPFFMLWMPALFFSFKAKQKLSAQKYEGYCIMANRSLTFNILTAVVGIVGYTIALTLLINLIPSSIGRVANPVESGDLALCNENQCYEYCRLENSAFWYMGVVYSQYWTCYSDYNDYFTYQNGVRLLHCIQRVAVGKYVCSNDRAFADRWNYMRSASKNVTGEAN